MGISYLLNIISISLLSNLLNTTQERITGNILNNFANADIILLGTVILTLIENFNLWPTCITLVIIGLTWILLLFQEKATEKILQYLILVLISIGVSIAPVFFMQSTSIEARMCMSIGSIIGMSFIYLTCLEYKQKTIVHIIQVVITVFFVFNCVNAIQIFTAHIATNIYDENMANMIKYEIEKYEQKTGNEITKVGVCKDQSPMSYPAGWDKKLFSFTQRAFDNFYCIVEALNYFCGRKFERVPMSREVYEKYFENKNWDTFSDEQIVFEKDTMYMCTY